MSKVLDCIKEMFPIERNFLLELYKLEDLSIDCCTKFIESIKVVFKIILLIVFYSFYTELFETKEVPTKKLIFLVILSFIFFMISCKLNKCEKKIDEKRIEKAREKLDELGESRLMVLYRDLNEILEQKYYTETFKKPLSIGPVFNQYSVTFFISTIFVFLKEIIFESGTNEIKFDVDLYLVLFKFMISYIIILLILNLLSKFFYKYNREMLKWRDIINAEVYRINHTKGINEKKLIKLPKI